MSKFTFRNGLTSAAALAGLAALALVYAADSAAAKPATHASCTKKFDACAKRCIARYPGTSEKANNQQIGCVGRTCSKQFDNCIASITKPGGDGKIVGTSGDPLKPKGGDTRTPPTGGAKDTPKAPPKVSDTRAPLGGGVFGSKTSGSGSAGSGTILRTSSGNGGNTPTFRSVGAKR